MHAVNGRWSHPPRAPHSRSDGGSDCRSENKAIRSTFGAMAHAGSSCMRHAICNLQITRGDMALGPRPIGSRGADAGAERSPGAKATARAAAAAAAPGAAAAAAAARKPPLTPERLKALWPDIWAMIKPRRGLLALGFVLMLINRVSGLVLPASTKFLIDDVIGKRHIQLLVPIVLVVVAATLVQGATSFGLTQLLSKAAQRLIAELRRRVQAHVGRLPVAYYDANKTGTLVARIMSDVEGIRNLIGTGLVEFVGGIITASIALVVLLRISHVMTLVTFGVIAVFVVLLNKA